MVGRIKSLTKYEFLRHPTYPYIVLAIVIVALGYINPLLYDVLEIDFPVVLDGDNSRSILDTLNLYTFVYLGKTLYRVLTTEIFRPWLLLVISAIYALTIARDMKREHLRFIFSLPIDRWEYITVKILISTLFIWIVYYISTAFILYLRFGYTSFTLLLPLSLARYFIVVSAVSIATALITGSDIATVISGFIGFIALEAVFVTVFAGNELYNLSIQIEPYRVLGLVDEVLAIEDELIRNFLLGMEPDIVSTAITVNNLHIIYSILSSLTILAIGIYIFMRRDID
ncbi:TPA: hypothetical protein EYP83_02635 [Candidatus Geothermarchaeota archaeon]|nr:hypothetical protein [Candidatus Geothermarchaeota archaeon]HIQ13831.1 hypothetical protein [Thermoprotei archaeon]